MHKSYIFVVYELGILMPDSSIFVVDIVLQVDVPTMCRYVISDLGGLFRDPVMI